MSKPTVRIPHTYPEPCKLHNAERGWWQCGVWVQHERNATIYPNVKEAGEVKLLRGLPYDTEIVRLDRS